MRQHWRVHEWKTTLILEQVSMSVAVVVATRASHQRYDRSSFCLRCCSSWISAWSTRRCQCRRRMVMFGTRLARETRLPMTWTDSIQMKSIHRQLSRRHDRCEEDFRFRLREIPSETTDVFCLRKGKKVCVRFVLLCDLCEQGGGKEGDVCVCVCVREFCVCIAYRVFDSDLLFLSEFTSCNVPRLHNELCWISFFATFFWRFCLSLFEQIDRMGFAMANACFFKHTLVVACLAKQWLLTTPLLNLC